MDPVPTNTLPSEAEMASYSPAQLIALVQTLASSVQSLQHRLEWFQRQMFGAKSEKCEDERADARSLHVSSPSSRARGWTAAVA